MFEGNRPVLILPLILTAVMFIGGIYYLKSEEPISNEQLQYEIDFKVETVSLPDGVRLNGQWDWTMMPNDGIVGTDYISVTVVDSQTGEVRTDISFEEATLQLIHGGNIKKEISGVVTSNGVIFAYPNETIDHTTLGPIGKLKMDIFGEKIDGGDVRARMIHTWTAHESDPLEDATFQQLPFPSEDVSYWMLSR